MLPECQIILLLTPLSNLLPGIASRRFMLLPHPKAPDSFVAGKGSYSARFIHYPLFNFFLKGRLVGVAFLP